MKHFTLIVAATYGLLAVILGALGSHALKNILTTDKLVSFETGIRYQMYHAIVLLVLGLFFDFSLSLQKYSVICLMIGTLLFSFSIYFLSFTDYCNINLKFLGPITPLGGIFLIIGWILLIINFAKLLM